MIMTTIGGDPQKSKRAPGEGALLPVWLVPVWAAVISEFVSTHLKLNVVIVGALAAPAGDVPLGGDKLDCLPFNSRRLARADDCNGLHAIKRAAEA